MMALSTIQSIIIYGGAVILSFMLANLAQKNKSKKILFLVVLLLSFFAGLRAVSVGLDTKNYVRIFEQVSNDFNAQTMVSVEESFKIIVFVLMKIFSTPQALLFIFALIINCAVVFRFWDFKDKISLSWAITIWYLAFYILSLNILRQMVACSIIFYCTRFINKKTYLTYLIGVFIAYLFHKSAVIGGIYLVIEFVFWKELSKSKKIQLISICTLGVVAVCLVLFVKTDYLHYLYHVKVDIGVYLIGKIIFFIISLFVLSNNLDFKNTQIKRVVSYYSVGLLLTSIGFFFEFLNRVGLYLMFFEAVYYGLLLKEILNKKSFELKSINDYCFLGNNLGINPLKKRKAIYYIVGDTIVDNDSIKLVVLIMFAAAFLLDFYTNGNGHIPYLFFWQ